MKEHIHLVIYVLIYFKDSVSEIQIIRFCMARDFSFYMAPANLSNFGIFLRTSGLSSRTPKAHYQGPIRVNLISDSPKIRENFQLLAKRDFRFSLDSFAAPPIQLRRSLEDNSRLRITKAGYCKLDALAH